MANSKVSDLTAITAVSGSDVLYLVDITGTTSQKATVSNVLSAPEGATGNLTAGTGVIWASGTAGKWTGVVTTGNLQAGTSLIWPSGTATTYTGLTTAGNLSAGTSVIWPSGTATVYTGLTTAGNLSAGTSVIWASGTAAKWTGLTTSGNVTAGTTVTASGGYFTAGTTRIIVGTAPVTGVVGASFLGDILFNNRPAAGSATHWVCTAPGNPGTWLACGSAA